MAPTSMLPAASTQRPNIIVIMVDDMGFSDLGCYGSEIRTPNLDRLAAQGLRFTQFYNTAKCETSRQSLMSGLWHHVYQDKPGRNFMTIAEVMRGAGYTTLMTGKWHIDGEPLSRGFDRYFGHLSGATDFFKGDKTFLLNDQPFTVPEQGFYTTDANTDYAMRFVAEAVKEQKDKPFFLYIAYNAPHYPLQAPKEEIDKYRGKYRIGWDELRRQRYARQLEMGLIDAKWPLSPRAENVKPWTELDAKEQDDQDLKMATYAAMIDRLDQNIGRLTTKLKELAVDQNTILMFFSDNGGCPFDRNKKNEIPPWQGGGHWTYDASWAGASNTPFRWYKQNNHEGGIASPMIIHWPAGIAKGGGFVKTPAHLVDILPTCAALAGTQRPAEFAGAMLAPLNGQSLVPLLQGGSMGERALFWNYTENRAIRMDPWKLVSAKGGPWELYHMEADRCELNNLAASEPARVQELSAAWEDIRHRSGKNQATRQKKAGKKSNR
ncbi:MAG TPA: arylsulfatase [Luteolibacter sp.]|nr:arylsulfatase [Luteolibacter sp.]